MDESPVAAMSRLGWTYLAMRAEHNGSEGEYDTIARMKRIGPATHDFHLMRLLDRFARSRGASLQDQSHQEAFVADLIKQIEAQRRRGILIHGMRIQTMFAYVAAALGNCRVIKEEDAGEIYVDEALRVPDFRIVTVDGQEFLVEVKNCHESNPRRDYRFTRNYLESLQTYARIMGKKLYIALYWSRPRLWTLVLPEDLELRERGYAVTMLRAIERNSMHVLGDAMIGTLPSLSLRLFTDPDKPRTVGPDGHASFTIKGAALFCEGNLIEDDIEKDIAWFLINYGDWPATQLPAEIEADQLIATGIGVAPDERANPNQQFEMIGVLSQMISRQYNETTSPEGSVKTLSPSHEPDKFGVVIPKGYRGKKLPLWRFVTQPRADEADRKPDSTEAGALRGVPAEGGALETTDSGRGEGIPPQK